MKVIVLGSGGWIPTKSSETCCFLVACDNELVLLDSGTGASNLAKYEELIGVYDTIHVIFSHYHLDHIVGFSYLIPWFGDKKIVFYGPGEPFYQGGIQRVFEDITKPVFHSVPIDKIAKEVSFINYDLDGFLLGGLSIGISQQVHTAPSFGINIDNKLHYATDTTVIESTFEHADGADLLLHECWDLLAGEESQHSSAEEIINLANKHKSVRIGLIHKNPLWNDEKRKELSTIIKDHNMFISEDGMVIEIG